MFRKRPTQSIPLPSSLSSSSNANGSRSTVDTTASPSLLPLHQNHHHHHHSASCSHSGAATAAAKPNGSKAPNNSHDTDANKYVKRKRLHLNKQEQRRRQLLAVTLVITALYALKRCFFPLSHDALNRVDYQVRRLWLAAEQSGLLTKFPPYQTSLDYHHHFPYFSLLEQHYLTIRTEALALLQHNRQSIPRLKDLVESKRAAGKVYSTDWKTCTYVNSMCVQDKKVTTV
jgi:hypothetical protein